VFGRKVNISQLESSGKELLASGDYEEAGRLFEQAAEASLNQKNERRAIEDFMAAGRVFRNVDQRRSARCFLRAGQMQVGVGIENYPEAIKCYESAMKLYEKLNRDREAEITLGWLILTQMAQGEVEAALSLTRKALRAKHVPGIVKTILKLARGQQVKTPDLENLKDHQHLISTAFTVVQAYSALRAQLNVEVGETIVGQNIDVTIHFRSKTPVKVTAMNLYVTNHAKQISKIEPAPPFSVNGKKEVKISLALTLAGGLTIGPLSFDFESAEYQFSGKTLNPIAINVLPAKGDVKTLFEQQKSYLEEGYVVAEGDLTLSNESRGIVETIELGLRPPPEMELVGTAASKTINMLAPGRSVSFPICMKAKVTTSQTLVLQVDLQIDQASKQSIMLSVNFELPELEEELEEETDDWLKDLEAL
jgi:tetratricopeptide (TPR) repeat protein